MASRKQKKFKYTQNGYVEGYVPAPERTVEVVSPDIVISNPIIVNQIVSVKGINKVQTLIPVPTFADGDIFTNSTFDLEPAAGSAVYVTINGRTTYPANGASELATTAFYITDSTGTIIRTQGTFQVGDRFRWQASIAGIEILSDDEIKLIYEV